MGTVGGGTGWRKCSTDVPPAAGVGSVHFQREAALKESACSFTGIRGQSSPQSSPHPRLLLVRKGRLGVAHPSSDMGGHALVRVP